MLNYQACEPGIKKQIVDMSINGSGVRGPARVLKINKNTVISALKKIGQLRSACNDRVGECGVFLQKTDLCSAVKNQP